MRRDWMPAAPHPARHLRPAGPTPRQPRISGALHALTGPLDELDTARVGREQRTVCSRPLDPVDAGVRRVAVGQETGSIHPPAAVRATWRALPRVEPVVWRPTAAPWLPPIETLWHGLRRDVLTGHRLADEWPPLRQQVNAFLDPFAHGSSTLLRAVGLLGDGHLAYVRSSP
jgi:hypothetical protein